MKKTFALLTLALLTVVAAFAQDTVFLKNFNDQNVRTGLAFPLYKHGNVRTDVVAMTDARPFTDVLRGFNYSSINSFYGGVAVSYRLFSVPVTKTWITGDVVSVNKNKVDVFASLGYSSQLNQWKNPARSSFGFGVLVSYKF